MSKDKGMKEDDVTVLLKDRQKGENAYKIVSRTQPFLAQIRL